MHLPPGPARTRFGRHFRCATLMRAACLFTFLPPQLRRVCHPLLVCPRSSACLQSQGTFLQRRGGGYDNVDGDGDWNASFFARQRIPLGPGKEHFPHEQSDRHLEEVTWVPGPFLCLLFCQSHMLAKDFLPAVERQRGRNKVCYSLYCEKGTNGGGASSISVV